MRPACVAAPQAERFIGLVALDAVDRDIRSVAVVSRDLANSGRAVAIDAIAVFAVAVFAIAVFAVAVFAIAVFAIAIDARAVHAITICIVALLSTADEADHQECESQ